MSVSYDDLKDNCTTNYESENTLNEFENPYIFIRDNYFGNGGYSPYSSFSYLIRHPREIIEFYKDRVKNAVLENIFAPLQDLFIDPIISANIEIKTQNKILEKIIEQTKIENQANKSLLDFKLYGKCIFSVYTDIVEDGETVTVDQNVLPDVKQVFPADVKILKMNGLDVDSAEYIQKESIDRVKVPVSVVYKDNVFTRKTLAWRTEKGNVTLEDLGEAKRITDFDGRKYGVLNKIGLSLADIPKTFALAQMQKLLFNLDTQRLDTLRKSGFPILVIQTNQEIEELTLSENMIMKIPAPDAGDGSINMPEWLETQLNGVDMTTEIIAEKKSAIYKVFTNGLFSDNIQYTTVMSSVIATKSFSNVVNTLYKAYQMILEKILDDVIMVYNLNTTYNVTYPDIKFVEESTDEDIKEILS